MIYPMVSCPVTLCDP